jgi:hypothetical protein
VLLLLLLLLLLLTELLLEELKLLDWLLVLLLDELLLLELLEELLELLELLLLELTSSSWRPMTITSNVMSPPFALNRISWLLPSVTSNASSCGLYSNMHAPGFRAPPLATVKLGTQVALFVGSLGLISKSPVLVRLFWIQRTTTSSNCVACPSASFPAPAPMSLIPRS